MTSLSTGPDRQTVTQRIAVSAARARLVNRLMLLMLPLLVLALSVVFAVMEPRFLDSGNLINVARQSVFLLLIALGQMVVLINAQLDLSVGATVAFTSVVVASVTAAIGEGPLALLAGVAVSIVVGVIVGLFNGLIVAVWRVPSFMTTLGTASILTGIALLITRGAPITGVPFSLMDVLGTGVVAGIPVPVVLAALLLLLVMLFMTRVPAGRNMYAVGGNAEAARVAGINVKGTLILAFVVCATLSAIAGLLLTSRLGSGEASIGGSYVMLSIAAAVLGGTSLFGGEGIVWRVLLGVLFLGVLSNGMNLLHVASYIQEIVIGAVLILAVGVERVREKV